MKTASASPKACALTGRSSALSRFGSLRARDGPPRRDDACFAGSRRRGAAPTHQRRWPPAGGPHRPPSPPPPLRGALHLGQRIVEVGGILEGSIHRREADVRNLVE